MEPAIIRLSKKMILSSETQHPDLVQLRSWIISNIEDIKRRRGGISQNWDDLHQRYKSDLMEQATDYGEGTRQVLRNRLPHDINLSEGERSFVIESSQTQIIDFSEQPDSLVMHYYLITEKLMLIGVIGDCIIVARCDQEELMQSAAMIAGTFGINFNDGYDIVEYKRIKI